MVRKTLQKLMGNNDRAFAQLFDDHVDALFRFVFWRVGDSDRAKDITSEVFTKAWEKWESFNGEYPKAWLFTIARNLVVDSYRKKEDELLDEDNEPHVDDTLAEDMDKSLEAEKLQKALSKLKPKSKEIIELRVINRYSAKEVADMLKTTEENIRIMQHRALKELRKIYEAQ